MSQSTGNLRLHMKGTTSIYDSGVITVNGDAGRSLVLLISYLMAAAYVLLEHDPYENPPPGEGSSDYEPLYFKTINLFGARYDVFCYPTKMLILKWQHL